MAYVDETSQEKETENQEPSASTTEEKTTKSIGERFICIKEVRSVSRAKALRLKTGDVIVGVEGKVFNGTVDELLDIFDEIDEQKGGLLTIWRQGLSFNLIIFGPLGCVFELTSDEVTNSIHKVLPDIEIGNINNLITFEVLRDIKGECNVVDTRVSQLGIFLPPVWLLQHRLWEPLIATLAIYTVTLIVHWALFLISVILISLYFRKAQLVLLRSFSLHKGKQIWMVIASETMLDAQKIARSFDHKTTFNPDLVGPPPEIKEPEKKRKKKKRKSSVPTS